MHQIHLFCGISSTVNSFLEPLINTSSVQSCRYIYDSIHLLRYDHVHLCMCIHVYKQLLICIADTCLETALISLSWPLLSET